MNLLDEKGGQQPVKTGGIASLLGATMLNVAEKTKDQNLYEQIRSNFTIAMIDINIKMFR